ncbi:hypothetical protein [Limnohabitans sp.]|uniref:hypothetical protein n=1 Tax=Limnohabitans sp. TaxID=1907725 RepID=UPI00286F73D7|nr:hypothetical protein [Limnohabitans sp.]
MLEHELMEQIYQGIDPRTGELLSSPRDPMLDKRRAAYLQILRRLARSVKEPKLQKAYANPLVGGVTGEVATEKPINQGARWTEADDQLLRDVWHGLESPTLKQVAEKFARNEGGISARLVKLGVYDDRETVRQISQQRALNQQQLSG